MIQDLRTGDPVILLPQELCEDKTPGIVAGMFKHRELHVQAFTPDKNIIMLDDGFHYHSDWIDWGAEPWNI